jgi:phosphomannomutase
MTLIKSISGIRGTIGGVPGEGLTPVDVVRFSSAYGRWLQSRFPGKRLRVVTGRDARVSGPVVSDLVHSSLVSLGIDVIETGLASTPTVEVAVRISGADGGIIVTASHNPAEWNALKLLNEEGEFLSASDGEVLLAIAEQGNFSYCGIDSLGTSVFESGWNDKHIDLVLSNPMVRVDEIRSADLTVVIDCVNSVGGIIIPELLRRLGVKRVVHLYCDPTGVFPHNPEPLPENITDLCDTVLREKADLGIVVDPDVDRLAFVSEDGSIFGEEYTLVAVADYILGLKKGAVVSNMSSSMALRDVAVRHQCSYYSSPVGEVNVVEEMKRRNAIIGGEGNGGIIVPEMHYGRDAIAGIALFLSHLVTRGVSCSTLKQTYPLYYISKNKIKLEDGQSLDTIFSKIRMHYHGSKIDERDGIKIENADGWVHLRASNTEPVIRIYSEAITPEEAVRFVSDIMEVVKKT